MHGRLKVRTTEEERERKKKEQVLKMKAYRAAMTKIQEKRKLLQLDDEMLQLTSQILLRNPDVATLWNIRRECVECKAKELQSTNNDETLQAAYDAELYFSEQCLLVNPKSYNCWHHRCWTLEHCPQPNWEREVQLCSKYLKMDERNFHTWDYRRYVAEKAGVPKEKELDFCTEKIKVNFSNYSSWHHRGLLLPELFPYEGDAEPKRAMSEAKLAEELELVLTAAFTDPNDSSAWFYQRWLLGYSRQVLDVCAFRCNNEKAILAFTNPIVLSDYKVAISNVVSHVDLKGWRSVNQTEADTTWVTALSDDCKSEICKIGGGKYQLNVDIKGIARKDLPLQSYADGLYYFKPPNRSFAFTASVLTELKSQLESCESLLQYEPDSKWTLLTSALIMRAIDRQAYHSKSLEYLEKLQKVDFLREGYYKDLASKWILEKALTDWAESTAIPKELNLQEIPQLNAIYYPQYLSVADNILLPTDLNNSTVPDKVKIYSFGDVKLSEV